MSDTIGKSWKTPAAITAVVTGAGLIAAPMFIRQHSGCGQTEQISNLRQIGLALLEFETEYGSYPSEATIGRVRQRNPDHGFDLSGESSNAIFRQLLAADITRSEQMFYAESSLRHKTGW